MKILQNEMNTDIKSFCRIIENRSLENGQAMRCFNPPYGVLSPAFSIIRQELDSMIRVIYLLHINDPIERWRLIKSTLNGCKWNVQTTKGRFRYITDREMVDIAQKLHGWTQSVYKFGCAFIHLSDFHNHLAENPFQKLSAAERQDILSHMRRYHGGPSNDNPDIEEISKYLPMVFDKIANNLRCLLKELNHGKTEYE